LKIKNCIDSARDAEDHDDGQARRKMTYNEKLALLMLTTSPVPLTTLIIGMGIVDGTRSRQRRCGRDLLESLAKQGAVERIPNPVGARRSGIWHATEKGKIAAALLIGKDRELRYVFIGCWEN